MSPFPKNGLKLVVSIPNFSPILIPIAEPFEKPTSSSGNTLYLSFILFICSIALLYCGDPSSAPKAILALPFISSKFLYLVPL